MSLQPGQLLDGKYRIVRLIGEGGMGAVYEGENARIRRKVAIKVLHAGVAENSEMVQRFEREAQVAGTVGNDHILEILDLGALASGERYMVMEFLDGVTLTDRIRAKGRLDGKDAANLIRQVLEGLAAAHGAGIVHRDLKPDNIFILKSKAGQRDYVKIIDFGISKFTEQATATRMTRTGALMGTPHYMAPEQATGSAEVDLRTDIYAVGIIMYEAVTGRVPFQAESFNQLLFEIALAKITPAREHVPDLDPALDSIILKASARQPIHRFQNCQEFVDAIDAWSTSGKAVSLPPEQSIEAVVQAAVPRTAAAPAIEAAPAAAVPAASVARAPQASPVPGRAGSIPGGTPVPGAMAGALASQPPAAGAVAPGSHTPMPGPTPMPGTAPQQPTLNTWANTQGGGRDQKAGGSTLLIATTLGMLLLVGGAAGAYFMFRPSPAPAAAASAIAPPTPPQPVETHPAPPPPAEVAKAPAPPEPPPAASVAPAVAPAPPAVAPAPAPATAPAVHRTTAKVAAKAPPPPPAPAKPPETKKKTSINFGY